ncbi:MAG: hypothetical protein QXS37_02185 [Candidatus Aenigmatarchaeota archaeon]
MEGKLTKEKVTEYILRDLKEKYPDAEIIDVIEISPSDGSFYVKAKVVYNYSSKCPIRFHVYYDYPRKGFVSSAPYYVTTAKCKVCEEGTCVISSPEEAIIASHTLKGSESISSYLRSNPNAKPEAKYYKEFIDKEGEKHEDVWIVKWFSKDTNYGMIALISMKGEIIKTWVIVQEEKI